MDLIPIIIFAIILYIVASKKSISPWSYVLNYIFISFLLAFAVEALVIRIVGLDILRTDWYKDPQAQKVALIGFPFALLSETIMFFFFRNQINKVQVEEEEETHPTPPEKKDFSYFR